MDGTLLFDYGPRPDDFNDLDPESDYEDEDIPTHPIDYRVRRVSKMDLKDQFIQVVNSLPCEEDDLACIREEILDRDSVNCAAAVLAGETKILDITAIFGCSPLHSAAEAGCLRIMSLLLQSGFSTDFRYNFAVDPSRNRLCSNIIGLLPLNLSLSLLRNVILEQERTSPSALACIFQLFSRSRRYLEMVRLLALSTSEIKNEFYNYLKGWNMIEVAALLLAVKSRVLSSSAAKGEFRSISEMRKFMVDEMISYINTNRLSSADADYKSKLFEIEETLLLLEIFDRIGDKLATLIRLREHPHNSNIVAVASLIEDAGFDVKVEKMSRSLIPGFIGVYDCTKARSTFAVPIWRIEAKLGGLADKSRNGLFLTYPFLSEAKPKINCVSASVLASSSATMPSNHLLMRGAPFLGALKRIFR